MRHALIIAGGSGTRLWPMSRAKLPKQLIPFIGGKSLLQLAFDRLDGLVPASNRFICAGQSHADVIAAALDGFSPEQFLGEPIGRDTLNAVGFSAAAIAARDPDAVIAVFTADHVIEPADEFLKIVGHGFRDTFEDRLRQHRRRAARRSMDDEIDLVCGVRHVTYPFKRCYVILNLIFFKSTHEMLEKQ